MLNKIARATIRRPNLIQGSLFNVTFERSFGAIVRSRPQDDIAELDENYKHGHVSKFVMRDFLKAGQKESVAFIEGTSTGRSYTYGELHRQTYSLAKNLQERLKIGKGDVVAIMSPNNINYFACFNGIPLTGGISTTINPLYTKAAYRRWA